MTGSKNVNDAPLSARNRKNAHSSLSSKNVEVVSYRKGPQGAKLRKRQPKLNNLKQSIFASPLHANVNLDTANPSHSINVDFSSHTESLQATLNHQSPRGGGASPLSHTLKLEGENILHKDSRSNMVHKNQFKT